MTLGKTRIIYNDYLKGEKNTVNVFHKSTC